MKRIRDERNGVPLVVNRGITTAAYMGMKQSSELNLIKIDDKVIFITFRKAF